ncbi:unnamed protein product [Chrysodeixis includens]|uniref:Uncharacterized protein n=1 Tax=Chrysodeixis includens TaxID=689277 RepID=A0A9P0FYR9_CHRIL|nr:unnamed protein product [Chrysodeixis includens]
MGSAGGWLDSFRFVQFWTDVRVGTNARRGDACVAGRVSSELDSHTGPRRAWRGGCSSARSAPPVSFAPTAVTCARSPNHTASGVFTNRRQCNLAVNRITVTG